MSDIYVGQIVLSINGVDYDVKSVDDTVKTGRVIVRTMNRSGKAKGTAAGMAEYELRVSVAIPKTGEPIWEAMVDGKLTIEPQDGGGLRETWTGVSLVEMGSKYTLEGEAVRDLTLVALNKYTE